MTFFSIKQLMPLQGCRFILNLPHSTSSVLFTKQTTSKSIQKVMTTVTDYHHDCLQNFITEEVLYLLGKRCIAHTGIAVPILEGQILSSSVVWLSFEAVVLSKLNTEIARSFIVSQTATSAQKQNGISRQYI